ncbi:hypothetical protein MW871_14895 [Flavobacterium sp. I-SCBP12n]|uniref:Uncharacterized protein n=1 Tax=Flavobacterium pygoscelis TaxID=2893176 RepID=A0A9X1XSU1_9FLAO|nr:hypothetical protein [Flavobacterium pygoscelis]MCK8143175.1 hypothetical protein [Flavobacterium pygoscelis]
MSKKDQYLEIILQTNKWFENKTEQLKLLINKRETSKILIEDGKGNKVDLPDDMKEGFYFGIQTALEVYGNFPVKINRTNDSN